MKKLIVLIFCLISLIGYSQEPSRCTGKTNENDKPQGLWTCTFPSGKIQFEINYEDGLFDGVKREYYEDGKIKFEIYYSKGELNGAAKEYYSDGLVKYEGTYTKGVPSGTHKEYKEDRSVKTEKDFGTPSQK